MIPLAERILHDLKEALRQFGTYQFGDKGPSEVMDLYRLEQELRKCSPSMAAAVLVNVATSHKHGGRGLQVAEALACALDDWDDLFKEPGIDNIYNGELP